MSSTVIKKYDELMRCTNVLTEGIELEFHKFVAHQEKCRKKWYTAEEENHETKKYMAKYKAEQDTLEVKLKMARHQLDIEMKKRLKAEQAVDHMARQLELIKELLLDKDTDKRVLAQSIHKYDRTEPIIAESSLHISYTVDDSSIDLPDSEFDMSENDIMDDTGGSLHGDRRKGKRGHPSAPPLHAPASTDETSEDADYAKRTRVSEEDSTGFTKTTRVCEEVHRTVQINDRETRFSTSPSKYKPTLGRAEQEFERPPRPEKRPPSKSHVREFVGSSSTLSDSYDTDEVYDQENPIKSKGTTITKHNTVSNLYPSLDGLGTPPKKKYNTLNTPNPSRKPLLHSFVTKIAVRMETCGPCNKKLRFGSNVAKCKECKAVCHPECKDKVPNPCYPTKDTPGKTEGAIECYVESRKSPQIPDLVTQCIEEIENRGLKEQGLYRIPGVDKEVKELKEKFLRKKSPDLHKIRDTHVLCGCLKDFLRGLSEPLVTFSLHESFMSAAVMSDPDDSLSAMYQCVSELHKVNRETLAAIIVHLQKVASSAETQMNFSNLSKVFGPTLVGHRSSNPTHIEMLEDTRSQPVVVTRLLEMPSDYWSQFLNGYSASTRTSKTPLPTKTPPYNPNFKTPTTPECKEAPETLLGSIDPTSQPKTATRKAYNAMTPKVVSKDGKRQRHFFNSPS